MPHELLGGGSADLDRSILDEIGVSSIRDWALSTSCSLRKHNPNASSLLLVRSLGTYSDRAQASFPQSMPVSAQGNESIWLELSCRTIRRRYPLELVQTQLPKASVIGRSDMAKVRSIGQSIR